MFKIHDFVRPSWSRKKKVFFYKKVFSFSFEFFAKNVLKTKGMRNIQKKISSRFREFRKICKRTHRPGSEKIP